MPVAIWNISGEAAFVGVLALLGALIAAATAQYRLRAQLNHDTEMREREATRDSLDGVVNEINSAVDSMISSNGAIRELYNVRSANQKLPVDPDELAESESEARRTVQMLSDHRASLMGASFRLHLRFDDTDPIIGSLTDWRETLDALIDADQDALDSDEFGMKTSFEAAFEVSRRLGAELNDFLEIAREWSNSRG